MVVTTRLPLDIREKFFMKENSWAKLELIKPMRKEVQRHYTRYISCFKTVEPSSVQVLKNPNPLKDVEALAVLDVAVLV